MNRARRSKLRKLIRYVRALSFLLMLGVGILYCAVSWSVPIRIYEGKGFSKLTFDQSGRVLDIQIASDGRYRSPIRLSDVPRACIDAALMYEDRHFYSHPGVDPKGLFRALTTYAAEKRSGGSTLTMQLVRLRTGLNTKGVGGKVRQIWEALVLERNHSKDEILEAYFTFAPYGGGLEGLAAASAVYFEKTPAKLTPVECVALAVLPQKPTERFGFRGEGFRDAFTRLVLALDIPEGERSINFPDPDRIDPSHLARHLTVRVLGSGGMAQTTIDRALQESTEGSLSNYVESKSAYGLSNGAVLIADAHTGETLAYAASKDFANPAIRGFVDGITAKRSPGSLLKPFVYAQAIDEGVIVPESVLADIPVKLTSYEPENFERNFLGLITAREALVKSRNIPALLLNSQLSEEGLYTLLQRAGMPLARPADYYGAAVVLGGIEVSLMDAVKLYTAIATDGKYSDIRSVRSTVGISRTKIFSPEAAYLTREMLKTNPPPPGFSSRGVAWKTGTSSGGRDAWAVGSMGQLVVGVWLGNFDGSGNPNFVGRDLAGPLLFELFERIRQKPAYRRKLLTEIHRHELQLAYTKICPKSGLAVTDNCPHQKRALIIPGVSPIRECDIHRDGGHEKSIYSSEIAVHFQNVGINLGGHLPISTSGRKSPPRIISPEEGVEYRAKFGSDTELELRARIDGEASGAFWYADGSLIGRSEPGRPLFWKAKAGKVTIRVIDSFGLSDAVTINVTPQEQ